MNRNCVYCTQPTDATRITHRINYGIETVDVDYHADCWIEERHRFLTNIRRCEETS